jgi:hypothetical protein
MEASPERRGYYPWLGVCGSLLGMLFALAFVPQDPQEQGALQTSGICLTIGLLLAPLYAGFRDPRNFLRTENIIGATPVYWLLLDLVQGTADMPGTSHYTASVALCTVGVCTAFFWLGTMGRSWRLPRSFMASCAMRPPVWSLFALIVVLFVLAMLAYAIPCDFNIPYMFQCLGMGRWDAPWCRGRLGDWDAFRDHLHYFGYLLPAFATMLARRRGWFHPLSIISVLMAITYLLFLAQGGSRRLVGATLGAAVCYWVLDRPKVKFTQVAIAGGAVVAILWLMQIMIYARDVGFKTQGDLAVFAATQNIQMKKLTRDQFNYIRVDDNFYRVTNIVGVIPKIHDWVYFDYLYYVIIRPIPRVIWKNKPIDPGFAITLMSNEGTLLSCTILGELWMTWGFGALAVGGWFLGRLARLNAPLLYSTSGTLAPLFYGYLTMWLFVGYRSLIEIVLFTYPLISWMAVVWLMRRQLKLQT